MWKLLRTSRVTGPVGSTRGCRWGDTSKGKIERRASSSTERLDDWIDEDSTVRVIDVFVDELDLRRLGFDRAAPAPTGQPTYHLATLLKIYVYGCLNRV